MFMCVCLISFQYLLKINFWFKDLITEGDGPWHLAYSLLWDNDLMNQIPTWFY